MVTKLISLGIGAVIVILFLILIFISYIKAPPNMAYIISGPRKKPRILIGKAGLRIPFIERLDKLFLGAIQIDVKTGSAVPTAEYININVDSTVSVKVSQKPELLEVAAQNFLNASPDVIRNKVNDLLEGNIREIVGSLKLTEMVSNRKAFSEKVQENAIPDLEKFGLELISFNVQNFIDNNDVIANLGIDNVEQIRKDAAIAKSNAQREIAIAEADNLKQANDAKVQSEQEIAERNTALAIRKANLQKESDTQVAQAEAAKAIEIEHQRQLRDVAATEANIATAQKQAELKQKEIELKEYELDAVVRKQADADRYKSEQAAAANLVTRQRQIDAERYEREQGAEANKTAAIHEAEAMKAKADAARYTAIAEAEAIKVKGEAEAEAIRLRGEAEAVGIEKKAEAQKKMETAAILEMYFKMIPEAVGQAAAPLAKVDKIVQYGDGNSTKMISDIMGIVTQVSEALTESGVDIKSLISGAVGGKIASN